MTAIVLLSGGIDSTVTLALAAREVDTIALVVDYGQRNRKELVVTEKLINIYGHRRGRVMKVTNLDGGLVTGAWDTRRPIEQIGAKGDQPRAYTAGRNTILLSLAAHVAERNGADQIWIGANRSDREGYPDCRHEFFDAFEKLYAATGYSFKIRTPLIDLDKRSVVMLGRELNIDFSLTTSCYSGTECEVCDACVLRRHALETAQGDDL